LREVRSEMSAHSSRQFTQLARQLEVPKAGTQLSWALFIVSATAA
jgi:hypothetical protein